VTHEGPLKSHLSADFQQDQRTRTLPTSCNRSQAGSVYEGTTYILPAATSPGKRRNTSDEDPKFENRRSNSTEEVISSRSLFSHETVGHNNGDLLNDSPKPQDIPESSPQVPDNLIIPASHIIRSGSVGAASESAVVIFFE
jgi:hypothetical protein